jgi:hypothetical protein
MNPLAHAFFHELSKLSSIDPAAIQKSIDDLERIEQNSPDLEQLKRNSILGAVSGPIIGGIQDLIENKTIFQYMPDGSKSLYKTIIKPVSRAAAGVVATGVLPVIRHKLDRNAQRNVLQKQLGQLETELKQAPPVPDEGMKITTAEDLLGGEPEPTLKEKLLRGVAKAAPSVGTAAGAILPFAPVGPARSVGVSGLLMGPTAAAGLGAGNYAKNKILKHLGDEVPEGAATWKERAVNALPYLGAAGGAVPGAFGGLMGPLYLLNKDPNALSLLGGTALGSLSGMAAGEAIKGKLLARFAKQKEEEAKLSAEDLLGTKRASSLIPSGDATPAASNASSDRVGLPRMTNLSGPSIGSLSRTYGKIRPGAAKGRL